MSTTDSTIKAMPLAFRVELHAELIKHAILPSCANCLHIETGPALKCLKWHAVPPLNVIATGCIGWEQDIPF